MAINTKNEVTVGDTLQVGLLEYTRKAMYHYGSYVNEDRALPDYRDGLKPVYRRSLWAMKSLPKGQLVKTARVVGDVIGKYHPHGDMPVAGAIETLVNSSQPPIFGKGNWGTSIDPAAAMRYTNIRLTSYGETFLKKEYLAVSKYISNYDDTEVEPVILPALLPNLLLNGAEGIGYGTITRIPSYTLSSILQVMIRILSKETLTEMDYVKTLKFKFPWGGTLVNTRENRKALLEFYKTGEGSVMFESDLVIDEVKGIIKWRDFCPGVSILNAVDRIRSYNGVDKVINTTDKEGVSFEIRLNRSIKGKPLDEVIDKIRKATSGRRDFRCNVTERTYKSENKVEVRLFSSSVPELLTLWLKWRIKLELDSLKYQLQQQQEAIAYTKLLIHAIDHLQIVMDSLRKDDPALYLSKSLKITTDQANQILDLKVRQLSKLDKTKLQAKLQDEKVQEQELSNHIKAPVKKVKQDFVNLLEKKAKQ